MDLLLGINRIPEIGKKSYGGRITATEREEIIPIIQESLKKIVLSVSDLEYNGQKMTYEGIKNCLEKYKVYGIELSIDEILQNKNGLITQNSIGKATVSRSISGIDIANEKVANDIERTISLGHDLEQNSEEQK